MKTNYNVLKIVAIALLVSGTSWGQTTLAQWNFNGADAASVPGGGSSPLPVLGAGTAGLVGGVSTSATPFASGVGTTASSDPIATNPPNLAWAITNYAALGTENKQRGIQVNVSTVGFADVTFRFDQRLSNKAGNTYVVQYTTDRTAVIPVWVDAQTFTFTPAATGTGDIWYNLRSVDLSAINALDNNANAAFRVVGAFDPVAGNYLASTSSSTYDGLGVTRFDMVTVSAATTLGVSQFEANANDFRIFPNPSNKEVVTFNQTQDIEVFDTLGKLILKAKNTNSIDTKSFHSGIYFVRTGNGLTRKLIVK
jgi:Secretion system C-terminal sorting domain